jgi:MFS family permease
VGLVTAILVAVVVLVADELSCRLRGFWPTWARLLVSGILGFLAGAVVWGTYTYLYLEYPPESVIYFAGAGLALGFVLASTFKLPGWAAFLVTTIATYIPINVSYNQYMPPVIYYDYPEQIWTLALPLALLIALGGHAEALLSDARRLWRRMRK